MPYSSPAQRAAIWANRKRQEVQPSRHDIAEYYTDPQVRQEILSQLRNRPVMAIQSLPSGQKIVRRNLSTGDPIQITKADFSGGESDLGWYTDRRFAEFHPVIGTRTDKVWVDIDPGPNRSTESLKPLVRKVVDSVNQMSNVQDVQLAYSGGRGFHVRGILKKPEDTDSMRVRLTEQLKRDFPEEDVVFQKPKGKQVRLDTSTLKRMGSIRALRSINVDTGRVALPLSLQELDSFNPSDAALKTILKSREIAPGIPQSQRIHALPDKPKKPQWTLAIQEHDAKRAGKHWDLRLVDPHTGFAHSWAVPKAQFPTAKPLLAIQTPTHTSDYALNFGGKGPQEIGEGYGKGTVEIKYKEPVKVVSSSPDKIKFQRIINGDAQEYMLFRTKDNSWLIRNIKGQEKKGAAIPMNHIFKFGYFDTLVKLGIAKGKMPEPSISEMQQPLDNTDMNTPVGMLADLMQQLPDDNFDSRSRKPQHQSAEDRLNRDVSWSSPTDIPYSQMDGPTPWVTLPGGTP